MACPRLAGASGGLLAMTSSVAAILTERPQAGSLLLLEGETLFQSRFMSTMVQPRSIGSVQALSSFPIGDWRS
jgi:hypothetical protein